jgi:hypothetical protein
MSGWGRQLQLLLDAGHVHSCLFRKEGYIVCVCVCVCVRERERERERNAAANVVSLLSESVLDFHVVSVLPLR